MKKYKLFALMFFGACCGTRSLAQSKPVMKFNHLAVFVTDLQRSREFYTQVLGLDSIAEPFHDGKHLWLNTGSGTTIHVIAGSPKTKKYYQNNHICLSTSDMDQLRDTLKKNKVDWKNSQGQAGMTTTRKDGILQLWVQDPDGYWIEINNDQGR